VIFAQLYPHLFILGLGMVLLQFFGYPISIYYLQIPVYTIGLIAFLFGFSLITSTLATIVRDVQMILQSVMRMLLYLSPILWPPTLLPESWHTFLKFNPFYFIIEGYRSSLLGQGWYFIEHPVQTAYFFGVTGLVLMIGSYLHLKFRNQFIDFL
jgi:teichoic acid transport system permease protein